MTYALPKTDRLNRQTANFLSLCGSHSLAYHSLQSDLSQFQTQYGYIAYQDFHNETIVLGDPISKEENYDNIIEQFLQFRPQCSFIQIGRTCAELLSHNKFSINYFGVESQIDLPFQTNGKQKKDIRLLTNAAKRNDIDVREIFNRHELQFSTISKDNHINNRFHLGLHAKEYAFLSRPINRANEKDVRIFGGFQSNRLVSYSLFDPMYTDNKIIGYAEVISRQVTSSPKGSRTHTLLQAMSQFAQEDISFVNIGLLPFYLKEKEKNNFKSSSNKVIDCIFTTLYKSSPFVSNFAGLSFHKSRYRGNLIPKYFATNSNNPYKTLHCIYKLTTGHWLPQIKI